MTIVTNRRPDNRRILMAPLQLVWGFSSPIIPNGAHAHSVHRLACGLSTRKLHSGMSYKTIYRICLRMRAVVVTLLSPPSFLKIWSISNNWILLIQTTLNDVVNWLVRSYGTDITSQLSMFTDRWNCFLHKHFLWIYWKEKMLNWIIKKICLRWRKYF